MCVADFLTHAVKCAELNFGCKVHSCMRNRITRCFAAFIALLGIVFAQLAIAHHVCPQLASALALPVPVMDHGECGLMAGNAALCKQHCDNHKQSVGTEFSTDDATVFIAAYVLPQHFVVAEADAVLSLRHLATIPQPPPLSRNANLRI